MHFESLPSTSPASKPILIRSFSSSSTSSTSSTSSSMFGSSPEYSSSRRGSTCAFPSWPTGNSLSLGGFQRSAPSSYISDEDLFPEDLFESDAVPFLDEAPAPPRQIQAPPQVFPLLPLYAPEKPKKQRRRSSRKQRRPSKPMTPIAESPEAPE